MLLRITSKHFSAGLVVNNGQVITTAPILKYMSGWRLTQVRDYCRMKHWLIEAVPQQGGGHGETQAG